MHFLKHERLSGIQEREPVTSSKFMLCPRILKMLQNRVKSFSVLYGYHISSAWGIASILYCIITCATRSNKTRFELTVEDALLP